MEADLRSAETREKEFQEAADQVVVNDVYRRAARILSPDIARTYTEVLAKRKSDAAEDFEGALIEAREDIAALGMIENLQVLFDAEAKKLSDQWLHEYRDKIKKLPDDRQEAYRQISALSREPQDLDLAKPVSWMEATAVREKDGTEFRLPIYTHHLLCNDQGKFPADLNGWEKTVLKTETERSGFQFWYRNPDRPSQDSLGIAYEDVDEIKMVRPDFIFFSKIENGNVVADIVDPHGLRFSDALPKLHGLARYTQTHAHIYRRIASVAEVGGRLRVLDLTRKEVRDAIAKAEDAASLYGSALAGDY